MIIITEVSSPEFWYGSWNAPMNCAIPKRSAKFESEKRLSLRETQEMSHNINLEDFVENL